MSESVFDFSTDELVPNGSRLVGYTKADLAEFAPSDDLRERTDRERSTEFMKREKGILTVVKAYKDRPEVTSKLNKSRRPVESKGRGLLGDATPQFQLEVERWYVLDHNEARNLFAVIEDGLSLYRECEPEHRFSEAEEKKLMDLTISYQSLFLSNLRLVMSIANREYRKIAESENNDHLWMDLVQEGQTGLIKALTRFDLNRHFTFATYATFWIRQTIGRSVRNNGRMIRIPLNVQQELNSLAQNRAELTKTIGRLPTTTELAEFSTLSVDKITDLDEVRAIGVISLSQPWGEEGGELGDTIPTENDVGWGGAPDEIYISLKDPANYLEKIMKIAGLSAFEKLVVSFSTGLYIRSLVGTVVEIQSKKFGLIRIDYSEAYEELVSSGPYGGQTFLAQISGYTRANISNVYRRTLNKFKACTKYEHYDNTQGR